MISEKMTFPPVFSLALCSLFVFAVSPLFKVSLSVNIQYLIFWLVWIRENKINLSFCQAPCSSHPCNPTAYYKAVWYFPWEWMALMTLSMSEEAVSVAQLTALKTLRQVTHCLSIIFSPIYPCQVVQAVGVCLSLVWSNKSLFSV
jgi:hypothetical protein